jgi:hypothetical protein
MTLSFDSLKISSKEIILHLIGFLQQATSFINHGEYIILLKPLINS